MFNSTTTNDTAPEPPENSSGFSILSEHYDTATKMDEARRSGNINKFGEYIGEPTSHGYTVSETRETRMRAGRSLEMDPTGGPFKFYNWCRCGCHKGPLYGHKMARRGAMATATRNPWLDEKCTTKDCCTTLLQHDLSPNEWSAVISTRKSKEPEDLWDKGETQFWLVGENPSAKMLEYIDGRELSKKDDGTHYKFYNICPSELHGTGPLPGSDTPKDNAHATATGMPWLFTSCTWKSECVEAMTKKFPKVAHRIRTERSKIKASQPWGVKRAQESKTGSSKAR